MFNELLVLGQIPGTNLQITFSEILLAALLVGIRLYMRLESRPGQSRVEAVQLSKLHGFSYPIGLNPAAVSTRRKAVVLVVNTVFHRPGRVFRIALPGV